MAKWKKQTWTIDHDNPNARNADNHYANTHEHSTAELQLSSQNKPQANGVPIGEENELKKTLFKQKNNNEHGESNVETEKNKNASKKNVPAGRKLGFFEIYKFADKLDYLCMFIGSIACMGTGAVFPLMMFIYEGVASGFVSAGVIDTPLNMTFEGINNACIPQAPGSISDVIAEIRGRIKWYVILGCISILCYWIGYSLWMIAAERQVRRMRYALFRSIMRQEMGWFDKLNPGELSSRLVADLDKIRDGLGDKKADFISLICRLIGGLVFAFTSGWKLALVFISLSPLTIIAFNVTMRVIIKYTRAEVAAYSKASAVAQEVLGSIRTVTAFGGQKKEEQRFAENLTDAKDIGIKKGLYMGICQGFAQVAIYLSFSITFWYGPHLVRTECENYSGGTVIVIFVSCLQSTFSISQIVPNLQAFAEAAGSGGFVFDIISRISKINAFEDKGEKPANVVGDIELRDVEFTYPARVDTQILKKVSMKIPSGKTVALVGASGCGKSTTIQLIQRFYDPEEGLVLLDGRDIKTLNVAWLRSHIGIVSQEPVLFTGSIEENIRFGKPDATDDEVQYAAKMANAHDFIMELPENYKTSSGDKLSGGQKQRVAIARALISNPRILLLDEATSALDNTSERVVQDALDRAKQGRTTIVIAHRLSTIRNADLIIALDKGEVIENGTHDDLMEKKGLYYELVTAQQRKEKNIDAESSDDEDAQDANKKYEVFSKRTMSVGSVQSVTSDTADVVADDETTVEVQRKKFFRQPFIFKILKLNMPEISWILIGSISSMAFGCLTPIFALFFSNIYGLFAERDINKANILTRNYVLVIFFTGVAGGICQCISSIAFSKSGEALTMRMRTMSFGAMLRQEMGWFDREENNLGALVTQLSSDASSLKGLSGLRMGVILNAVGAIVSALVIAFLAGWKLTLVILLFVPLMIFTGTMQGKRMANASNVKKAAQQKKEKLSWAEKGGMFATEAIDSVRAVVGLHQEEYFISNYEDCFNKSFRQAMIKIQIQSIGTALANSLMFFIHATAFGYGSFLVEKQEMEVLYVFRVFSVVTFGAMSVGRSTAMIPDYAKGKESAIRILKLNSRQSKIDPQNNDGIVLNKMIGNVQFDQVKFKYPSRPTLRVLKDFKLLADAGQTTALCGPSGSGKSTCVALLLRFYDPSEGTVLLDGHDIRTLSLPWLRSQIGFVQQEPVLFNLSIRDNIAYGDNTRFVSQQEIEEAAKKANIHDTIVALPDGYDTSCGAKGSQMSGGQKQRIAIARALIRDPKLLLLDEATSALDIQSEKVVQAALDVARNGRTCLTIAHRLVTIRNSEKIVVVDHGRIKESGTNDELMEQKGIYYKLNMAQERNDE
ncbi:unnamed protein product [Adineta ricciae]|uniref:Uncharacterized protein n=1 Tax=Adineta ricciae TaxID=249248 RepID=A0A814ECE0_ADIRI|nr:unnamed protein product [Adineta ricciae]CAF0969001.1 unnamed protein product [Adineta ricciae]